MSPRFAGFEIAEVDGVPLLWRRDDRFKSCRVMFQSQRALDEHAAARSILPALLLHGTTVSPDRPAMARRMESLYGAAVDPGTRKSGESHLLRLTMDVVSGRYLPGRPDLLTEGLEFLAEQATQPRLEHGGFPRPVFERERQQAVAAARALIDHRGLWAVQRAIEHACVGEPMAIPEHGGIAALEALDPVDPERVRADFLTRGRLWMVASGAFEEAELQRAAARFVAALPRRQFEPVPGVVEVAERAPRTVVERVDLQQAKLILILRMPLTDDLQVWIARRLLIGMFGGGTTSRLFKEVREARSLAYYAQASLDREKGLVMVQIGLDESSVEAAVAEAMRQFHALCAGDFTAAELDTARAQFLSAIDAVDDSVGGACQFVSEQWRIGADRTPADLATAYRATDHDAVVAAAQGSWLDCQYLLGPLAPSAAAVGVAS